MKVLYLHNSSEDSEKANLLQVKAMCKAISESGNDVLLSLLNYNKSSKNGLLNTELNYKVHERSQAVHSKRISKYFQINEIRYAIDFFKPDLIYVRSPLLLFQLRKMNIPLIVELHNNKLHKGSELLDKYWRHFLLKHSKTSQVLKVVCISETLAKYWIEHGISPEKITTAHDAIDHNQFDKPLTKEEARKRLNLQQEKKIITYLGRLYKNRKIDNIIQLAEHFPQELFLIVGGPNTEVERLKKILQVRNVNNVRLTGQVPHRKITNYLYASDILLALWSSKVNTINYCSPLKLFEYMGAGRTIVAHGFPTILEVLKDQHNAIICEPDSTEDLIKKVGKALGVCESSDLGRNARKEVFEKYTWQKRVDKIFKDLPISY